MPRRTLPSSVGATLRALTGALAEILGASLVGVYLYGSLTQGAFDPSSSDIDVLVVVRRKLTEARFRKLRAWLAAMAREDSWVPRLQMQVLVKGRLLRPDSRGALYQFGVLKRSGSDGNPLVWLNVLASGVTLTGPAPSAFLPPITKAMILAALTRELEYLRAEICDPASTWRRKAYYRTYAVLTVCRILHTRRMGRVTSKPRAASWALRALSLEWRLLIRDAVNGGRGARPTIPLWHIARFIRFAMDTPDPVRRTLRRPRGRVAKRAIRRRHAEA